MSYAKQVQEYRKNAVQGANPIELVVMLYDAALRHMEAGKASIAKRDLFQQNEQLQKAQQVVTELMASLDIDRGGEIAGNLLSLYNFVFEHLVAANLEDSAQKVDEALKVMSELRQSWAEISEKMKPQNPSGGTEFAA